MNQDFISQTPLDQITGTDYGQMLKAAIPYLPARSRQILSIYEKAMECVRRKEEAEKGTGSGCDRPDCRPQRQRG